MSILVSWLVLSVTLWLTALLLPGVQIRGFGGALVGGAIFGLLHWLLGFILFVLIGVGTLGIGFLLAFLTRWFVDAILLKLTDAITEKVQVRSFGWAFAAALVMSFIGSLLDYLMR